MVSLQIHKNPHVFTILTQYSYILFHAELAFGTRPTRGVFAQATLLRAWARALTVLPLLTKVRTPVKSTVTEDLLLLF